MANTENMTDEAMAAIFGGEGSSIPRSGSNRTSRMNLQMDGRPAATVMRRTKRTGATVQFKEQQEDLTAELTIKENIPIIGDVMERVPTRRAVNARPTSMFAMERRGFPSLSRPVGTFVKKSSTKKASPAMSKPFITPNQNTSTDPALLPHAIERDAKTMLAQMSATEIKENVQELETALSPEMLKFLKSRSKTKGTDKQPTFAAIQQSTSTTSTHQVTTTNAVQEKERMAQVLSSIQTLEDLDEAYEAEMGNDIKMDTANPEDDWKHACNLLRSTSMRQSLWAARTVCQRLEMDVKNGRTCRIGESTAEPPYPTILPVSLRCLLDNSTSNGGLLLTFVLRSIYALLQLRAPRDHAIDVTLANPTSTLLYREYFLDDAVPTPSFGGSYPKGKFTPVYSNEKGDAVAYSTSSSSTSATLDAASFWGDPMWTLLSKMKIIPRLAQLLDAAPLPRESMVAICGVLAMLSIRSPGAAAAIAQHKTMLPRVLRRSLIPPSEVSLTTDYLLPSVAIPSMILLCTIAGQSRTVAAAVNFDSIVPPLLAMDSCDPTLLQWALILWRTTLRYGLGLQHLQFVIARSVLHVAKARAVENPIAVEFLTCFSNVLDCVKVAKHQSTISSHISQEDMDVLMNAELWLSSTLRQAADLLGSQVERPTRLKAACLCLLQSHASIYTPIDNQSQIQLSEFFKDSCYSLLATLKDLSVDGTLSAAAAGLFLQSDCDADEAASCAFVNAFAALSTSLISLRDSLGCATQRKLVEISKACAELFVGTCSHSYETDRARRGWLNQTQFRIVRLLLETAENESTFSSARSLAFDLIGRLEQGDEAQAAILFSNDKLFMALSPHAEDSSRISSLFMGELFSSSNSRKQLDHSFKMLRGFGITTDGWGPFALDSLLSEAERIDPAKDLEKLLPMGSLWLWQVLSGDTLDGSNDGANSEQYVAALVSCLELLLDLECNNDAFTKSKPLGSKLYHLANLCLAPESVLRRSDVSALSSRLVDHYVGQLGSEASFGLDMMESCFKHSVISTPANVQDSATGDSAKLFETLTGDSGAHTNKILRSCTDFVADLCTAFVEYGAQYDVFVKVIRIFWRPEFPSKIRVETVTRLRDVMSLLTLPDEAEADSTFAALAVGYIMDGLPGEDGVNLESPEMLDLVSNILKKDTFKRIGTSGQRDLFLLVSCGMLGRSLAGAIKYSTNLEPSKRRMAGLPSHLGTLVCQLLHTTWACDQRVTARSLVEQLLLLCGNTNIVGEHAANFTDIAFASEVEHARQALSLAHFR
jgi:RPAP1-like, N-terminal